MAISVISRELRNALSRPPDDAKAPFSDEESLKTAFGSAQQEILSFGGQGSSASDIAGTTATVLWLRRDHAAIGHIGDSRLYRFRNNKLERLTRDHTIAQEVLEMGRISAEEVENSPYANLLSKALGIPQRYGPDVSACEIVTEDLYLLCSDGLSKLIPDPELEKRIQANRDAGMDALADRLLESALEAGGPDNISLILVEIDP